MYNGLGQLITEYQEHSGAVNPSTSLNVQYAYNEMTNGENNSRPTSMTYPNGRVLNSNYASGVDDTISRLTSLSDSSATLEVESYLGLNTVVQRAHPQANVNLTYLQQSGDMQANHDGGDQYTGLDRFGRVIDQFWVTNAAATLDRFQYGFDRDSNVLTRNNLVNTSFSESDNYDSFNQLTYFQRGSHKQTWTLDPLGNWQQFTNDGNPQTRTNNVQNQITSISGMNAPTYDNNGNTLTTGSSGPYTYDAWNRLVHFSNQDTAAMAYDALGRRIQTQAQAQDLYYSSSWQVIEERSGGVAQTQYVWSPAYVDPLIERDTSGGRLYVQQDANWNVTAVLAAQGPTWIVGERYVYDPYGAPTVLDPGTWAPRSSLFSWIYLFQGGRYDGLSGLYNFRFRDYSPTLGRWMQQDPIGYSAGDANLYGYERSSPTNWLDSAGTDVKEGDPDAALFPVVRNIDNLPINLDIPTTFLGFPGKATLFNIVNKWKGCDRELKGTEYTETKTNETFEQSVYVASGTPQWEVRTEQGTWFFKDYTRVYFELRQTYDVYLIKFRVYKCCRPGETYPINVVEEKTPAGKVIITIKRKYEDYPGKIEIKPSEILKKALEKGLEKGLDKAIEKGIEMMPK